MAIFNLSSQNSFKSKIEVQVAASMVVSFLLAAAILGSKTLAVPFAFLGASIPIALRRRKQEKRKRELAHIWPELLDHMISGLRSGLSIAETLSSLAHRGPEASKSIFLELESNLRGGMDIGTAFLHLKVAFDDPIADQVCEVLDFARGTGNRDTALTLRTLGDFIRSDISVRGEINAKLGWVKNSAVVAAIAPWILLGILSAQPSTVVAFSTATGILILITGVALSAIAYLWMGKVGRVPEIPRIFMSSVEEINAQFGKEKASKGAKELLGARSVLKLKLRSE